MKIRILETDKLYAEMIGLPENERSAFFDARFLEPFKPLFELTGMPRNPEMMSCLPLTGADDAAREMLRRLADVDTWNKARKAIEFAEGNLTEAGIAMPGEVTLGIFLGNPIPLALSEGYMGIGSMPGYIQIMIAPDDANTPKLPACVAHEFHHNALFQNAKWNFMNVMLSQYLAVEGLAESFATALYGDDNIGPWVTGVTGADLERTRRIVVGALDASGFMEVRKYMYGAHPLVPEGEATGIPYCGGYAVGYHAVQSYMQKTGKTAAEATKAFLDGDDIIRQSGYFVI